MTDPVIDRARELILDESTDPEIADILASLVWRMGEPEEDYVPAYKGPPFRPLSSRYPQYFKKRRWWR